MFHLFLLFKSFFCVIHVFRYDLLPSASHLASTFDCVVSCVLADSSTVHSLDTLAELARVLKPGGKLILEEVVTGERNLSIRHIKSYNPHALSLIHNLSLQK